jgi:hypothetical protein
VAPGCRLCSVLRLVVRSAIHVSGVTPLLV